MNKRVTIFAGRTYDPDHDLRGWLGCIEFAGKNQYSPVVWSSGFCETKEEALGVARDKADIAVDKWGYELVAVEGEPIPEEEV